MVLLALSITGSKNANVFMVSTKNGMFSVKKDFLVKRGITPPAKGEVHNFSEPTMVVLEDHKKGDYLFPSPHFATIDSSRTKLQAGLVDANDAKANEPAYITGVDKPTWTEAGTTVKSFISFANYKAQLEIEKLEKELLAM